MFYVYVHRRADNNAIFYVGKGKRDRATSQQRNIYWKRVVAKHGFYLEKVATGLTEDQAFSLEIDLIAFYGRRNLCNLTDGGEGRSGSVQSTETKSKISKTMLGVKKSEKTKEKMKNAQNMPEARELRSLAMKGKIVSSNTRKKLSEKAKMQHKDPKKSAKRLAAYRAVMSKRICCIDLNICFSAIADAELFLIENYGVKKGANKNISTVLKGKRSNAYGFQWCYA